MEDAITEAFGGRRPLKRGINQNNSKLGGMEKITTIQRTGRNTDLGIILITRTLQELVKAGTLPDGMCNLQSVHY